jgi:integrase
VRIATAQREQRVPTIAQIKHVISLMPASTEIEKRDRALIAFTLLTGTRDGAIASMKLKHVDLIASCVSQDAREVKTKFSKTFNTFFFPMGEDIREIVAEWVTYLREIKLWGNDDPLFPATAVGLGKSRQFEASGLRRSHWNSASPIRAIFRRAFEQAGLPYFNPHSFRNTLAQLGEQVCKSPEQFKAWSQSLGHENALTTLTSYGEVPNHRQAEIMRDLAKPQLSEASEVFRALALLMRSHGVDVAIDGPGFDKMGDPIAEDDRQRGSQILRPSPEEDANGDRQL